MLVAEAADARALVLVSYRPVHKDDWGHRPNYRQLQLVPFAGEDLAELLQVLLGSDAKLAPVKSFVMERASGNPFFAEEIVRALADNGVLDGTRGNHRLAKPLSSAEVPPTVQAVLAARIDALPAAEKRLLQEAAVIGYDVPLALLHAICGLSEDDLGGLLGNLQDAEFLYASQLFPELQYRFKHAFTHDVAYGGVLRERRRDIHARTLDAMERLYADRLGEQVERLAHHAVRGELREKAVHYLREAASKAATRSALPDARAWFEQALEILNLLPKSQAVLEQGFEIRLELRPVLRQLGEGRKMLERLREAEVISDQLKDDRRRGQIYAFMATVLSTFDDLDEALVTSNRALEIAHELGDLKLRILATSHLEQAHYYRGDYERAVEIACKNLAELPPDWVHEYFGMAAPASVFGRAYLIMSLAELGRFAEADRYEAEAIQLAEPTQHAHTISWARFAASTLHLTKGEWAKALSVAEQWVTMLRKENVGIHLPWAVACSAWALAQIGESDEALSRIQQTEQLLDLHAARGIVAHRGWAYHAVGRASLILGRLDEARRLGHRALESCERQPGFKAHALRLLGDVASHSDGFDAEKSGATYYREAMVLAEQRGMRSLAAHCHFGIGRLSRRSGNLEDASLHMDAAMAMYRDMGIRFEFEDEPDLTSAMNRAVGAH
jgi:tetratricopeptide (TPR) repeat protein